MTETSGSIELVESQRDAIVGGPAPSLARFGIDRFELVSLAVATAIVVIRRDWLFSLSALLVIASVSMVLLPAAFRRRTRRMAAGERSNLLFGLVLIAVPYVVSPATQLLREVLDLGFGTTGSISLAATLIGAAGYLVVGFELLSLAPMTANRLWLLVLMLALVAIVIPAGSAIAMLPISGIRQTISTFADARIFVTPIALTFALWAPVSATIDGNRPRSFWRPLALIFIVTVAVGLGNVVLTLVAAGPEPNAYANTFLWVFEIGPFVISVLWFVAFGWRFRVSDPGSTHADLAGVPA